MRKYIISASAALLLLGPCMANAQDAPSQDKRQNIRIKAEGYERFKNVGYMMLFNDRNTVYSSQSRPLFTTKAMKDYAINPTASSFALIDNKRVNINRLEGSISNMQVRSLSFKNSRPQAVIYSSDARFLNVMDDAGLVHVLSIEDKYREVRSFQLQSTAQQLLMSSNNNFLVAINDKDLDVYNYETGEIRKHIPMGAQINAVRFNTGNSQMAVACNNGEISIYDTKDFNVNQVIPGNSAAYDIDFHAEGKYLAVVADESNIKLINLKKTSEVLGVNLKGGVSQVRLLDSADGRDVLLTKEGMAQDGDADFAFVTITDLLPYYSDRIKKGLDAYLDEWVKMRPDETAEQYRQRVNEENRRAEARRVENELATQMAGDMVSLSTVSIVGYNRDNGMLTISLDNLNDVYLEMPEDDVITFGNPDDLIFSDVVYGLTAEDSFEIIYAKVYNRQTGKTYTFDNLNRNSLDFLAEGNNFVDINLVQQASMEDVILQGFKEEVMESAKAQNLISDHTHISVNTSVEPAYDANGRKITNYNVDFNYQVDADFSAKDDFAAGRYRIEQSAAATAMLAIAKRAFEQDFAQYIKAGKKVVITITGSADALPINGKIGYDGGYGTFDGAPCFLDGALRGVSVSKASGITQNEQLAFLRAQGVRAYLQREMPSLNEMNAEYVYHVELSKGTGGEYRRIHLRFSFVDAF